MDSINEGVIAKLKQRAALGYAKYGVTMDRQDLTMLEWLQHAQHEVMDAAVYLEKLIRLNGKCKWQIVGIARYKTGCEHSIGSYCDTSRYEFCPFCGRKIEEEKQHA